MAIVDGSGVLVDPNGIDRATLLELANSRQMISKFDVKKLGPTGFRILVDENNVALPGKPWMIVDSGLRFRNEFHCLPLSTAELFVPCGGRPESVDLTNVTTLLNADGSPRFKYIVEGANLFFTQVFF